MHRATLCSLNLKGLVAALTGALLVLACGTDGPLEPGNGSSSLPPPLPDAIPFDALESGKIVFARTFPDESSAIYVVDVDKRRSWAFDPYDRQPDFGAYGTFIVWNRPSISLDGTGIVFRGGIWAFVVDIDGDRMRRVDHGLDYLKGVPSWSADGSQLYFWTGRYGKDRVLYAQSAAHPADRRRLTDITGYVGSVSVGPSGTVVFAGDLEDREGASVRGIYVLEEGAGAPRALIVAPVEQEPDTVTGLTSPVWSPDGAKIAYLARIRVTLGDLVADSLAVMVADADGTRRIELLRRDVGWPQLGTIVIDQSISWSPDGSRLLFNVPDSDFVSHLYLINADGSGLRAVTTAPGVTDQSPSWSR